MKKIVLLLIALTFTSSAFAQSTPKSQSAKTPASQAPASQENQSLKLNPSGPTDDPNFMAPPQGNEEEVDSLDELPIPRPRKDLSGVELEERTQAASKLINDPEVSKQLAVLKSKKAGILAKLKKNNCIEKGYDVEVGKFFDKLSNRTFDEAALSTGMAQMFNENEIESIRQNINNPPKALQPRISLLFIQFIMNESPILFSQSVRIARKQECLAKANFE